MSWQEQMHQLLINQLIILQQMSPWLQVHLNLFPRPLMQTKVKDPQNEDKNDVSLDQSPFEHSELHVPMQSMLRKIGNNLPATPALILTVEPSSLTQRNSKRTLCKQSQTQWSRRLLLPLLTESQSYVVCKKEQ